MKLTPEQLQTVRDALAKDEAEQAVKAAPVQPAKAKAATPGWDPLVGFVAKPKPADAVGLPEDLPAPKGINREEVHPILWGKEVLGNAIGMLAGAGPLQAVASKALREHSLAVQEKARGSKIVRVIDQDDQSTRTVPVDSLILSPKDLARFKATVETLPTAAKTAYVGQHGVIKAGENKPALENLETDAGNMQAGLLHLYNQVAQTAEAPKVRGFRGALNQGLESGTQLAGGVVGGTAAVGESIGQDIASVVGPGESHLLRTARSVPLTTAALLTPAGRALGRTGAAIGRVAEGTALGSKVAGAVSKVAEIPGVAATAEILSRANEAAPIGAILGGDAGSAAIGAALGATVPGLGKFLGLVAPEATATFRRWFLDRSAQAEGGAEAVVREVLNEPERVRAEVHALSKEASGRIRQGAVELDPNKLEYVRDINLGDVAYSPDKLSERYTVEKSGRLAREPVAAEDRVRLAVEAEPRQQAYQQLVDEAQAKVESAQRRVEQTAQDIAQSMRDAIKQGREATIDQVDPRLHNAVQEAKQNLAAAKQSYQSAVEANKPFVETRARYAPGELEHKAALEDLTRQKENLSPSDAIARNQSELNRLEQSIADHKAAMERPVDPRRAVQTDYPRMIALDEEAAAKIRSRLSELVAYEASPLTAEEIAAKTQELDAKILEQHAKDPLEARRLEAHKASKNVDSAEFDLEAAKIREASAQRAAQEALVAYRSQQGTHTPAQKAALQAVRDELEAAKKNREAAEAAKLTGVEAVGADPIARDLSTGIKTEQEGKLQAVYSSNPEYNSAVDQIHQAMKGAGIKNPGSESPISREVVHQRLNEALQSNSEALLRSPAVRQRVIKDIYAQEGIKNPSRQAAIQLDQVLQHIAEGDSAAATAIIGETAARELAGKALDMLSHNRSVRDAARADILESVSKEMAAEAASAKTKQLIQAETDRFKPAAEAQDPVAHMQAVAEGVAAGDRVPLVLAAGVTPESLASYLTTLNDPLLRQTTGPEGFSRIDKFVKKLDTYVESKIPGQEGKWADPGFESSVGSAMKSAQSIREVGGIVDRVVKWMKGSVTSRSLTANKNNVGMNLVGQVIRTGKSPMEIMADVVREGQGWLDYQAGEISDPAKLQMYRSIAHTGLMDTSLIEGEIGAFSGAGKGLWAKYNELMDRGYKFGDTAFKADEAVRAYRKIRGDLGDIAPGREISLDIGGNRTARITSLGVDANTGKPTFKVDSPIGPSQSVSLDSPQISRNIAAAGAKVAKDVFFDYSDVPQYLQFLRSNAVSALASPFFTWTFKALDVPGVKKGLVSHMLDYDGGGMYVTNDPGLLMRNASRAGLTAVRRATVLEGAKASLPKDQQELLRANQFDPDAMPQGYMVKSPEGFAEIDFKDWSGNNLFGASDLAWKLVQSGANSAQALASTLGVGEPTPQEVLLHRQSLRDAVRSATTPEAVAAAESAVKQYDRQTKSQELVQALWARNAKGMFGIEDALKLGGLEGGILMKFMQNKLAKKSYGRDPEMSDVVRETTKLALGGTASGILDVAAGYVSEGEPGAADYLSGRSKAWDTKDPIVESGSRYMLRRLFNVGMRQASLIGKQTQFIKGMEIQLRDSAVREAQREQAHALAQLKSDLSLGKIPTKDEDKIRRQILVNTSKSIAAMTRLVNQEVIRATRNVFLLDGKKFIKGNPSIDEINNELRDQEGNPVPPLGSTPEPKPQE